MPTSDPKNAAYAARLTLNVSGIYVSVLRGWTSVLATVGGLTYRFANTHLEAPSFSAIQLAQARELIAVLAGETHPIVLAGDFNTVSLAPGTSTYAVLLSEGGFVDAWSDVYPRDAGYTAPLPRSGFGPPAPDVRIDLVLVRYDFNASPDAGIVGGLHAELIDEELDDRAPSGRWPSDHAGVVVTLDAPTRSRNRNGREEREIVPPHASACSACELPTSSSATSRLPSRSRSGGSTWAPAGRR